MVLIKRDKKPKKAAGAERPTATASAWACRCGAQNDAEAGACRECGESCPT